MMNAIQNFFDNFNLIINKYNIKKFNKNVNYFCNYPSFLLKNKFKTEVTQKTIKLHSKIIEKIMFFNVNKIKLKKKIPGH